MKEPAAEKEVLDRLRESEAAYRTLAENIPDIVYRVHLQGDGMQFFNDRITDITGYRKEELVRGRICSMESRIVDEDRQRVVDIVRQAVRERAPFEVEYRFLHRNGAVLTLLERGAVVPGDGGAPLYIDGVIRDMTERKRAEEALRESESRYRAIVDSQAEFVVRYQPGGILTFVNDTICKYVNMKREELLGRSYYPFMHPDDRDAFIRKIEALDRKNPSMVAEARVVLPDGRESWHRWTHHAIFDSEGRLIEYQCTGRDVTEQQRAEEQLRESEEKFSKIFRKAPLLVTLSELETGRFIDVNEKFLEVSGFERDEVVGRTATEIGWNPEEQRSRVHRVLLAEGRVSGLELSLRRKDGREVVCLYNGEIITVGGKQRLLSIAQDITRRKQAESDRELFRNLINRSNDAIFVNDSQTGHFIDMNDRACTSLGYGRDELLKMGVKDIEVTFPDDRAWQDHMEDVKRLGSLHLEGVHKRKDGTTFPVEISVSHVALGAAEYMIAVVRDISERKRAEAALRERERRLAESQRIAHIGSWEHDLKSGRVFWSDELFSLLGLDPQKDPADFTAFFKMVHPDDQPMLKEAIDTTLREKKPFTMAYRLVLQDGTTRTIDAQAELGPDDLGELTVLSGTAQDVTERRRQEQALQKSEKMLQAIFDAEPECVKLLDADANLVLMNRAGLRMLQVDSLDQLKGQCVCPMVTSEYRDAFMDLTKRVFRGETGTLEFEMVGMRGRRLWMETHAVPLRNERDEIVALLGVTRDITARKQAEQERERLAKAVSIVTEGIAVTDEQDRFIYLNDAHARFYGYAPHELLGKTWRDLTPAEFVPLIERALARTLHSRENGAWSGEAPGLRRDGSRITTEITATARWSESGEYQGHICVVRDISERKRTDEALRASEARFRTITETASSGILVADTGTMQFLYANPEICRMLGYRKDELLALDVASIHPASELTRVQRSFAAREGMQTYCQRRDGSVFPAEIKSVEIELDGRRCLVGFFTDISEKRLLEEERLKTQKLESVGTLAGGIAHDFNNLLQGIFGYISMAKLTLDQRERSLAMLEQAEKALHQSVNLTTQLLTFSKGGRPVKRPTDLRPVIENAVRFALSGSRTDCRIDIAGDLPSVDADEGQISQVVQNIVLNADQAMPTGGTVEIAAKCVVAPGEGAPRSLAAGRYVQIAIRDTGIGIPGRYLDKIFDPYFTTKEKGSGLGLATSYSIMANHGGAIDVRSDVGKGTTFLLYLPLSSEAPEPRETAAAPAAGGGRRVLVMDDEELVRNVAEELMRELGHEVLCTADGAAAVEAYRRAREDGRPYDIVILDLTVRGGIGGMETLRRLREIDPAVRAVVSSGYSDDEVVADFRKYGFSGFLKKPYDLTELREALDALGS